tara:strand:- start:159994 stop:161478 length:1485 start_codon:yes stop_codon:yes gene_type:complete
MNSWDRREIVRALMTAPVAAAVPRIAAAQYNTPPAYVPRPILGHTNPREAPFTALGNGINDDTAAIQGAIDAAIVGKRRGGGVFLPAGKYKVTKTLHIENVLGLKFSGVSVGATQLHWAGPSNTPMFLLRDARDVLMSDFQILSTPAKPLYTAIQSENGPDIFFAPSQNHFQRLIVNGKEKGGLTNGFRLAKGPGGDNNNDFHEFLRCQVRNYDGYAYSIEHSQSHTNRFYSCTFSGNRFGLAGVRTKHGSFSWYGGGGGGNAVSDFLLGSVNVNISIINGNFEDSKRLLVTAGPTGARWPILIQGIRFASGNIPPDGIIIDVQNPGPLILKNNLFGTDSLEKMPRVRMNTTQRSAKFISHGNLWRGQDANDVSPYIFQGAGSRYVRADISGDAFVSARYNNDQTKFADGDTKPPVHFSNLYRTENSRRTVITHLRNGWPGARLTIAINDNNTIFNFSKGNLRAGSVRQWKAKKGGIIDCLFDGSFWRCQPPRN